MSDLTTRMVVAYHDSNFATKEDRLLLIHVLGCTMRRCSFPDCKVAKHIVNHAVRCESRSCIVCAPGREFLEFCKSFDMGLIRPFSDCDELVQPSDDAASLASTESHHSP